MSATATEPMAKVTFSEEPGRELEIPQSLLDGPNWKQDVADAVVPVYPAAAEGDISKKEAGGQWVVTITPKAGKKG